MNNEQPTYSWPYPGQIIYPRVPGAKFQGNCELCIWNWFSPTFEGMCFQLQRHLLLAHDIDIEKLGKD